MQCLCRPLLLVVVVVAAAYLLVVRSRRPTVHPGGQNVLWPLACSPSSAIVSATSAELVDELPSTYLYVAVYTAPADVRLRQTIRATWLAMTSLGVEVVRHRFPLGTKRMSNGRRALLDRENGEHGVFSVFGAPVEPSRRRFGFPAGGGGGLRQVDDEDVARHEDGRRDDALQVLAQGRLGCVARRVARPSYQTRTYASPCW